MQPRRKFFRVFKRRDVAQIPPETDGKRFAVQIAAKAYQMRFRNHRIVAERGAGTEIRYALIRYAAHFGARFVHAFFQLRFAFGIENIRRGKADGCAYAPVFFHFSR